MLHTTLRQTTAIPVPKRFPKGMRRHVMEAIELHQVAMDGLIALLDAFDGDTDLEPALGASEDSFGDFGQENWAHWDTQDREAGDVQDEPHDADPDEASLGWVGWMNQPAALGRERYMSWANTNDMEAEHDGREPEHG